MLQHPTSELEKSLHFFLAVLAFPLAYELVRVAMAILASIFLPSVFMFFPMALIMPV